MFKTAIYSKSYLGVVYKFYTNDEGRLFCIAKDGNNVRHMAKLRDLPEELKINLQRPTQQKKLREYLNNSRFTPIGCDLEITGDKTRLYGGWGDAQHLGFVRYISEDRVVTFSANKGEGTRQWALDMGFGVQESCQIGTADVLIDSPFGSSELCTDPFFGQSWHFNVNSKESKSFSKGDSRIQHAVEQLKTAIQEINNIPQVLKNEKLDIKLPSDHHVVMREEKQALKHLGEGLHALQDVYSHNDGFVTRYKLGKGKYLYSHLTKRGVWADEINYVCNDKNDVGNYPYSPKSFVEGDRTVKAGKETGKDVTVSQRYSDAKTATYLYLLIFQLCTPSYYTYETKVEGNTITSNLQKDASKTVKRLLKNWDTIKKRMTWIDGKSPYVWPFYGFMKLVDEKILSEISKEYEKEKIEVKKIFDQMKTHISEGNVDKGEQNFYGGKLRTCDENEKDHEKDHEFSIQGDSEAVYLVERLDALKQHIFSIIHEELQEYSKDKHFDKEIKGVLESCLKAGDDYDFFRDDAMQEEEKNPEWLSVLTGNKQKLGEAKGKTVLPNLIDACEGLFKKLHEKLRNLRKDGRTSSGWLKDIEQIIKDVTDHNRRKKEEEVPEGEKNKISSEACVVADDDGSVEQQRNARCGCIVS